MHRHTLQHPALVSLVLVAAVFSVVSAARTLRGSVHVPDIQEQEIEKMEVAAVVTRHNAAAAEPEPQSAVVSRLSRRIAKRNGYTISGEQLKQAAAVQRMFLSRKFTLRYIDRDSGNALASVDVSVEQYPRWIRTDVQPTGMRVTIDTFAIAEEIATNIPETIRPPVDTSLLRVETDEHGVRRAITEGLAKPGYILNMQQTVQAVRRAILTGQTMVLAEAAPTAGTIANASGEELGTLQLLATGRSDFAGSGEGRKWNIHKGLTDQMNNIVIAPGETFSFNKALGDFPNNGPWKEALGIFNGGDLQMTIGGGLCQVATTMFRAAMHAGLPISNRANHSLFVHYYEAFGVGLDAAIFYGKQDLRFTNDTQHNILLQAYADDNEAFIHVYGTSDGRSVELYGPYFAGSQELPGKTRALGSNQIGWRRVIRNEQETLSDEGFVSTYRAIPRSIAKKHTQPETAVALNE